MVLIKDEKPTLFDTGFGSDIEETKMLIERAGVNLEQLHLIVNTHYHGDHVGGNHYLQNEYGIDIAAHRWEAKMVNSLDREVGSAEYLDQPLERYKVNYMLNDGDEINTGEQSFQVIHTPGHTLGHLSFYNKEDEVLIVGDLFHNNDVGWINIFREGVSGVYRSIESLQRLHKLPIKVAYSGHGLKIDQPKQSIERAIERLKRWAISPESIGWHACKRVYSYSLIIDNGMHKDKIESYLLAQNWFQDISRYLFRSKPEEFVHELIHEMIRSRAAIWDKDMLKATAPYDVVNPEWMEQRIQPKNWK